MLFAELLALDADARPIGYPTPRMVGPDQQRLDALYTENLPTFHTLQLVIDMQASH